MKKYNIPQDQHKKMELEAQQLGIPVDTHINNVIEKHLKGVADVTQRSAKTGPNSGTK